MSDTEQCVGCAAQVPVEDGPIHRYMTSAPACWRRYGELLSVLYARPELQVALVLCVDTYAVQHPGTPSSQAIQSVGMHLLNLHAYLVAGHPVRIPQQNFSGRTFDAIAGPGERESYWLDPPSFVGTQNVFDLPLAGADETIEKRARAWAESVWEAWSFHHGRVAAWYARYWHKD